MKPEIFLIAAVARNGVIGLDGRMPWHIPVDLRRFKALTMGQKGVGWPMVMGRKTFESLPGLLPGRRHIVLSRDSGWADDGAEVVASVGEALQRANAPHIAVIGGAAIYELFLPLADRIELTEIDLAPAGDTHFPHHDRAEWHENFREHHGAEGTIPAFDFVTLLRKTGQKQEG